VSSTEFHHNSFPQNQPSRSDSGDNAAFRHTQPERFVDPNTLAEHLSVTRRQILEMTRRGLIPGHPLGIGTSRKVWRYKISEVETAIASGVRKPSASNKPDVLADHSARRTMPVGSPRSQKGKL
jgi:xylose isomerase